MGYWWSDGYALQVSYASSVMSRVEPPMHPDDLAYAIDAILKWVKASTSVALPVCACLALSGCLTVRTVHTTCLPLRNYSQAEQTALANQLATIPPGSPLALAVIDLEQIRDMDRACLAAK